ncbi:MAG: DUF4836 family protein [Saprospiraceae bacterium]
MKKLSFFLGLIITVTIFQSCKKDGSSAMSLSVEDEAALAFIPSTAASVNTVNMKSLMDKMDFEEVKNMEFYQNMMNEAKNDRPELVYLMQDPTQSGIDLSKNVYMFSDMENPKEGGYMGTVFSINDATQFLEMLQKGKQNGELTIEEKSGLKVVQIGSNAAIAFNENTAIAVSGTFNVDNFQIDSDNANEANNAADRAVKMFTEKPSNNIASNKDFNKNFTGNHDFFSFQSSSFVADMVDEDYEMYLNSFDITKEDLKDNYTVSYADFKDGKMEARQEFHLNPKVKELAGAIVKEDVNTNFSKFIPADNLIGVMTGGVNMKGINTLLEEQLGATMSADMMMNSVGISRDDIMKAIDGDIFVAGYGNGAKDAPDMLVGMKIADQKSMDKILEAAKATRMMSSIGDDTYEIKIPFTSSNYKIVVKKDMMFVGQGDIVSTVASGKFKKADAKDLNKGSFGMYADMASLKSMFPKLNIDEAGEFRASGDLDGSVSTMTFDNKNQNSLKIFMKMVNEFYKSSNGDKGLNM